MKNSCIQHKPKNALVVLHQDYLDICGGCLPAAVILKILEYWTDIKLAHQLQVKVENELRRKEQLPGLESDVWIYKTYKDFIADSLGLLKEHQVRAGIEKLTELNFIQIRNNPKFKWDRTLQYKLLTDNVQYAINNECIRYPQRMDDAPVPDGFVAGNEAIPEITQENTSEITSSSYDEKWARIQTAYQNNITISVSPITVDEMKQPEYFTLPTEWWIEAIGIAAGTNKRNWRYVRGILDRSIASGLSPKQTGTPKPVNGHAEEPKPVFAITDKRTGQTL